MKDAAILKVVEANDVEVPKSMVEDEIDRMANELDQQLRYQGMGLNQYMEFVGKNIAEFREELRPEAEKSVKTRIVLMGVAAAEALQVTDEEREGFSNLLSKGFVDSFRYLNGNVEGIYSWWSQRIKTSKINNSGWRIDYFLLSDRIKDKVLKSSMLDSGQRQDHTPLILEISNF